MVYRIPTVSTTISEDRKNFFERVLAQLVKYNYKETNNNNIINEIYTLREKIKE